MQWVANNIPMLLSSLAIVVLLLVCFLCQKELRAAKQRLAHATSVTERLFQSSSDGMVIFDAEGRVKSLNRAAERLYGWSEREAIGLTLPMIPLDTDKRETSLFLSDLSAKLWVDRDTKHLTANGGLLDLHVNWSTLKDETGKIEGFLLVARDLTEIRRLESELLYLSHQLVSLNSLSQYLSGSAELRPTVESAVGELMTNLKLSYCQVDSVVSDEGDLLPTLRIGCAPRVQLGVLEQMAREAEAIQTSVLRGKLATLPIRLMDRTVGSMFVVFENESVIEMRLKVLEIFTQQLAAVLYTVSLLHRERETVEQMKELSRMRGDFVAMVSHELRTPLTCIKGFVDMLLRPNVEWSPEDQHEFLESTKVSTEQALRVVEDLLSIQQADYGKLTIHREPVDIVALVAEACRRAQSVSHNHSIRWSVPSGAIVLRADATRIIQVMDNLLSNAIKFSPLGGEVVVKAREIDGFIEVSVADNGIGIEPEHQALIFEKFFRADNSAARKKDGLGLGLSIVKSIVTLHGGKVWLTSTPNQGSTFYFTLPN